MHKGFADLSLNHLGTAPFAHAGSIITKAQGSRFCNHANGRLHGYGLLVASDRFFLSQGKSSDRDSHQRTR